MTTYEYRHKEIDPVKRDQVARGVFPPDSCICKSYRPTYEEHHADCPWEEGDRGVDVQARLWRKEHGR